MERLLWRPVVAPWALCALDPSFPHLPPSTGRGHGLAATRVLHAGELMLVTPPLDILSCTALNWLYSNSLFPQISFHLQGGVVGWQQPGCSMLGSSCWSRHHWVLHTQRTLT
jgi:hypothetical protein